VRKFTMISILVNYPVLMDIFHPSYYFEPHVSFKARGELIGILSTKPLFVTMA